MFSSFLPFVAVLASIYSFTFVAAIEDPPSQITPAPSSALVKRQLPGDPTPILSTLHYSYTALPEQVYPYLVDRGPQFGYNICNSTTQGNSSLCQTLIVNSPVRLLFLHSDWRVKQNFWIERLLHMGLTYTKWLDCGRWRHARSLLHPEYPWCSSDSFWCHYWPPGL